MFAFQPRKRQGIREKFVLFDGVGEREWGSAQGRGPKTRMAFFFGVRVVRHIAKHNIELISQSFFRELLHELLSISIYIYL